MAQDRLPVWPVLQPDAMAATYRQHAELEQWLAVHAPTDLTDQLADLCDRVSQLPGMAGGGPAGPAERASLVERQRERGQWLSDHHGEISTWSELEAEIQRYEYRLGQVASFTQPDYVTTLLGWLPDQIDQVQQWRTAAGAIEAYRRRWNLQDESLLGSAPTDPEQRLHWAKTLDAVSVARRIDRTGKGEFGFDSHYGRSLSIPEQTDELVPHLELDAGFGR